MLRSVKEIPLAEMPNEIRCVALDLDGTLLNSQGTLSEFTKTVLNHVISRGVHVVISSGRPFTAFPQEMVMYPGIEYAIASNGVSVHHLPTDRCLHRIVMDPSSVEHLAKLHGENRFLIEAHIRGCSFADAEYVRNPEKFGISARGVAYIQATRTPVEDMKAFLLEHKHELDGARIICSSVSAVPEMEALLADDPALYITSEVGKHLMELCHKDCGKHNGLSWMLDYLHLEPKHTVAFGNAENDADMLRFAGLGIAVSNSSPACLAAADYLTDSNNEDGVAHALCYLLSL